MPVMHFRVRWPDDSETNCYSPSLIIKDYFEEGKLYPLADFLQRSRAALDIASGFVIGKCYKRHRAAEFLDFLKQIDRAIPYGLDVHIVLDNYATHKTAKVEAWLARRPHYHVHFTPTSASWINQVER